MKEDASWIVTSSSAGTRCMASLDEADSSFLLSPNLTLDGLRDKVKVLQEDETIDKYALSKTAVNCYAQILARTHPDKFVKAVSPGFCLTGMCVNYKGERQPKEPELGATVFVEALYGIGKGKSGVFLKQASSAGTPIHEAETVETNWST